MKLKGLKEEPAMNPASTAVLNLTLELESDIHDGETNQEMNVGDEVINTFKLTEALQELFCAKRRIR